MQYLACRFGPMDARRYTYSNDGDPLAVGDFIKIADARNPAITKCVEVMEVLDYVPNFVCKPVLGKADVPELGRSHDRAHRRTIPFPVPRPPKLGAGCG